MCSVRLAVKLMNARFDDGFQVAMMEATTGADTLVCFNRLFDERRGPRPAGPNGAQRTGVSSVKDNE